MSKRTKLKLRNIRMYLAKYVFNGRYIVRNILAATVAMTVIVLIAGATMLIKDTKSEAAESVKAEELVEIDAYEITSVKADSIDMLKTSLEGNIHTAVQANKPQVVAGASSEFDSKFIATQDDINVRESAGTDSKIVGKLNDGAVGDIISSNGEWLNIKSGEVTGYVKSEFVLTGSEAAEYAKAFGYVTGTVTEDGVNVRNSASRNADAIETAYKGSTYKVDKSSTTTEWVCVYLEDGSKGYIAAQYVSVTESYPTATKVDNDEDDTDGATGNIEEVPAEQDTESDEASTEESDDNTPSTEEDSSDNAVVVPTTSRGAIALSDADINLMASIMTLECGAESYEGQLAVANVIINRLVSGNWGGTISDVVYAPNQFSVVALPELDYYIQNGAQESCIRAAREAASGVNNIGNYLSFRPTWNIDTSTLSSYTVIGNHVFY